MKAKRFAGQIKIALSGLLLVAIVVLVILQWPEDANCFLYGKRLEQIPTIWVVVASAVMGLLFVWLVKVLFSGLGAVRQTREAVRLERLEKRVKKQEAAGEEADE